MNTTTQPLTQDALLDLIDAYRGAVLRVVSREDLPRSERRARGEAMQAAYMAILDAIRDLPRA